MTVIARAKWRETGSARQRAFTGRNVYTHTRLPWGEVYNDSRDSVAIELWQQQANTMAGAIPLAKVPMWCKKCKVVFQTEPAGGENYTSSNRLEDA